MDNEKTIIKINPDIDILGQSHRKGLTIPQINEPPLPVSNKVKEPIFEKNVDFSIIHFIYITCIPIGIYLGKILYELLNDYIFMFNINLCLLCGAFVYTALRFDLVISDKYKLFDWQYFKTIISFNYKDTKNVAIICICMFLYTVEREENNVLYLYTKSIFNWSYSEYSIFKIIHIGLSGLVLLISVVYSKFFYVNKRKNIILGTIFYICGQIVYYAAYKNVKIFYAGLALSPIGILIMNNIRSFIPSVTTNIERINLFIFCGLLEQLGSVVFEILLQSLFVIYRPAIFYVSITNHSIIFILVLIFLSKKK